MLEQIFLRYDCECLFRFVTGCSSSHSVKSRSDSYLAAHRNNKAKCQWDAFIPSDMLKPGRAAERFLPQLKANLAAEKNANVPSSPLQQPPPASGCVQWAGWAAQASW